MQNETTFPGSELVTGVSQDAMWVLKKLDVFGLVDRILRRRGHERQKHKQALLQTLATWMHEWIVKNERAYWIKDSAQAETERVTAQLAAVTQRNKLLMAEVQDLKAKLLAVRQNGAAQTPCEGAGGRTERAESSVAHDDGPGERF